MRKKCFAAILLIFLTATQACCGTKLDSFTKLHAYLYKAEFSDIDYAAAKKWFETKKDPTAEGCSSIRNGNFYGRNYDWNFDDGASFYFRTPKRLMENGKNSFASHGVAGGIADLTQTAIDSKTYDETLLQYIPFRVLDGINECGVVTSLNVTPLEPDIKGKTTETTPDVEVRDTMCAQMLTRYILDNFATSKEAAEYIRDYISVFIPKSMHEGSHELHILIADENDTYLLEFVQNKNIVKKLVNGENSWITNFYIDGVTFNSDGSVYTPATKPQGKSLINDFGITPNAAGLERYNIINAAKATSNTKAGMRALLEALYYTKFYKAINQQGNDNEDIWYSELVGENSEIQMTVTVDTPIDTIKPYLHLVRENFDARSRDTATTWQTVTSSVYDIAQRKLYLVTQEGEHSGTETEFSLNKTSSSGCNAGFGALALLFALPLFRRKK